MASSELCDESGVELRLVNDERNESMDLPLGIRPVAGGSSSGMTTAFLGGISN